MLLAVVLGIMLGVVGMTLIRQWAEGALAEVEAAPPLSPAQFPRLAPSSRVRRPAPRPAARPAHLVRRAA